MNELCDLEVHINGHHTLHLHQSVMCAFSGRLRTMVKQKKMSIRKQEAMSITIRLADFRGLRARGQVLLQQWVRASLPLQPPSPALRRRVPGDDGGGVRLQPAGAGGGLR
ncbi:unnamed protein product [Urochloa humidicola]